jgi:hypothetical protein
MMESMLKVQLNVLETSNKAAERCECINNEAHIDDNYDVITFGFVLIFQ